MPFIPDNSKQTSSGFVPDKPKTSDISQAMKFKRVQFGDLYKNVLADQNEKDEEASALQRLLGQTLEPEEAAKTARGLTQDKLGTSMAKIDQLGQPSDPDVDLRLNLEEAQGSGDEESAKQRSQELIHDRMKQYVGEVQDEIQNGYDFSRWNKEADRLREKFGNKAYRAWERGSVHVVGGGLHLLEELQIGVQALEFGDRKAQAEARENYGDMARMYHKVLDTPEMQQVVDSTWEKYLLGGIETAPFIVASAAPALLTGGTAIPSSVGSFLTAYAVESNSAYQSGVDRGDPNARARGIVTGLINAGIEVVGGGGKKYLNAATKNAVGKLGKLKHFGKKTLHTALREGLAEEVPQEMVAMIIGGDYPRNKNGSVDWSAVATRLMDTAVAGILIGGVLQAPFAARHAISMPSSPKQAKVTKEQQEAEAADAEKVDTATDGMTGFDDKQNEGVPDYVAPVSKKAGKPQARQDNTKIVEDKPAVVMTDEGEMVTQQIQREQTIKQLVDEYTEAGMDPDKAQAWAEKTVGDEMPAVEAGSPRVTHYEPPQRHLEHIPQVEAPPVQVTDKETAEALAEKYGITGQEALNIMKGQRVAAQEGVAQTESDTLSESLEVQDKIAKRGTPTERLNRRGFYKLAQNVQDFAASAYSRFRRIDRMMEALDGHMTNGPIRKAIWHRLRAASLGRKQATAEGWQNFTKTLEDMGIDYSKWMSKVETVVPGVKLTKSQQIGVAMLSSNQHGRRYLVNGMKVSEDAINKVWSKVLTDPELKAVMNWMKGEYQRKWSEIYDAAIQAGIDPKLLQQEKEYFPIMHLSKDAVNNPRDIMSLLTDGLPGSKPDTGIIKHRQHGAEGEIELDAFSTYLNNLATTENFKFMAPAAAKVSKITGDPRFRKALNRATYGHGTNIMDRYVKHTVRGTSGDKMDWFSKDARHMRRNVKMYFIGYKVLTGARQVVSTLNGFTPSPMVAYEYSKIMKGIAGNWKAYENMREEAESKSAEVKYRAWDRDIKRKWTSQDAHDYMLGKQKYDKRAVRLMRKIDKFTVVTVWTSLYNHAKMNKDMNEADAIEFADTWIGKTQPMADPEYLPDFFRGGEVSKALTDFQQMPNQTWNTVSHDIVGARRAGKITNSEAMYRFLVAVVLPSLVLGAISRGRPQKDAGELITDLVMYPINAVPLAGPWLGKAIRGWDSSSNLATVPLEEIKRLVQEIQEGDVPGIAKRTATTVGSLTGKIPHQAIISAGGAYDLATGETKDPRRLLWSEYQLKNDESGGTKERTTTRRSSRRSSR